MHQLSPGLYSQAFIHLFIKLFFLAFPFRLGSASSQSLPFPSELEEKKEEAEGILLFLVPFISASVFS